MKANHNKVSYCLFLVCVVSKIVEKKNESKSQHILKIGTPSYVVSKIVEKKNESKSQLNSSGRMDISCCVKDR